MRKYIPKVGDLVKLCSFDDYLCRSLPIWAWLKVVSVTSGAAGAAVAAGAVVELLAMNGQSETSQTCSVMDCNIEPPLGWEPVYTIACGSREQAHRVLEDWFSHGINVWTSHDLSSGGRKAFTPVRDDGADGADGADGRNDSPHWQYTSKPTETVPAEKCESVFRVVWRETWEPELPPTSKKSARRRALKKLKEQAGVSVDRMPDGFGGWFYTCCRERVLHEPGDD